MKELQQETNIDDKQFESLKHDIDRILKILTSIVKTLNEKVKKK